jgi:hypothetical protein
VSALPDVRPALVECEAVIERGLATFVEVGAALLRIRDERLYREDFGTFEDYCRTRWNLSKPYASQLIVASETVAIATTNGHPAPGRESVARELAPLRDEPDALRETWAEVVDLHGEKPTAAQVREVVETKRPTAALMVQSAENEWYTPARYIEHARAVLGAIDLDPASCHAANQTVRAAKFYSVKVDGPDWAGRVWLNPPYGRLAGDFTRKLLDEYATGRVTAAVVLVNAHCTDTSWFGGLWDHALCFTDHRIDFDSGERGKDSSSTHGSVFAYLGPDTAKFADIFSAFGAVVSRWSA